MVNNFLIVFFLLLVILTSASTQRRLTEENLSQEQHPRYVQPSEFRQVAHAH